MVAVELTPEEVTAATEVGQRRADFQRDAGRTYRPLGHIQGAIGEYAFAKHLGPKTLARWWETQAFAADFKAIKADVGDKYQVRATEYANGGVPLTEGKDDPDQIFVLARVHELANNTVFLVGWTYAADAFVCDKFRDLPRAKNMQCSHLFPGYLLEPMETLP